MTPLPLLCRPQAAPLQGVVEGNTNLTGWQATAAFTRWDNRFYRGPTVLDVQVTN